MLFYGFCFYIYICPLVAQLEEHMTVHLYMCTTHCVLYIVIYMTTDFKTKITTRKMISLIVDNMRKKKKKKGDIGLNIFGFFFT